MRHQPKDISFAIADAGDVFNRTVRIRFGNNPALAVRVAQNHLSIGVEVSQGFCVREEATFAMRNRHVEKRPFREAMRERRIVHFHARRHHVTHEAQRTVPHERTGQETGFAENLEPVARTEHELAGARIANYRLHDWRKTRDGATTQIIAIRESTRQHDGVKIVKRRCLVPDVFRTQAVEIIDPGDAILITI